LDQFWRVSRFNGGGKTGSQDDMEGILLLVGKLHDSLRARGTKSLHPFINSHQQAPAAQPNQFASERPTNYIAVELGFSRQLLDGKSAF